MRSHNVAQVKRVWISLRPHESAAFFPYGDAFAIVVAGEVLI
jgi:hypothetical protein